MKKKHLLAPGPTPLFPGAVQEMSGPIVHHRTPEFASILEEVREGLKYLFQTDNDVLLFCSSGTGAMEGAVTNFLSPGDKALVVKGGKFGERWGELCQAYGVEVVAIEVPWGQAADPQEVAARLRRCPEAKAVFVQASETSTGACHGVQAIGEIVRDHERTILVVDAITALGVFPLQTDAWGLDVVVAGSQKALMLPPGLALVGVSQKAWRLAEEARLPRYYFDFQKERQALAKNQNAYTPAISLVMGLREVLREIKREGLEAIFSRHERLARATRAAMKALGLELYAPDSPSPAVTAVKVPPGVDGAAIPKVLREEFGIMIAGGQDRARGKIFRITHMGYIEIFDIITVTAALEMVLKRWGWEAPFGRGVGAALTAYHE
ncbi:MAG: pyridoxal-phosphate-dependent aminotransferase family protein [Dehalococcoidia bacterium]